MARLGFSNETMSDEAVLDSITKDIVRDVIRKVVVGAVCGIAGVGLFLNWKLETQAREQVLIRSQHENIAKRMDQQEAGMAELRSMLRGLEQGQRADAQGLRDLMSDMNTRFASHVASEVEIKAMIKELLVIRERVEQRPAL